MFSATSARQFFGIVACWSIAAVVGITVAVFSVGFLGLWVAIGAVGAVVAAIATGIGLQFAFFTDFDAVIEKRIAARDKPVR
jgi:hypothetical protein